MLNLTARNDKGDVIISPPWHLILGYEQAIRKKVCYDLNNGSHNSFRVALQAAWMDPITIPKEYYEDLENKKKP